MKKEENLISTAQPDIIESIWTVRRFSFFFIYVY